MIKSNAQKALEILRDGGKWCHRLEDNQYTRRDVLHHRLMDNKVKVVRGFGSA